MAVLEGLRVAGTLADSGHAMLLAALGEQWWTPDETVSCELTAASSRAKSRGVLAEGTASCKF